MGCSSKKSVGKILGKMSNKTKSDEQDAADDELDEGEQKAKKQLDVEEIQIRTWVEAVNRGSGSDAGVAYDKIEKRFKVFLELKANKYFIKGGDVEDIIQEGRIGLHKAIRDFDENRGMRFVSFACMCIERHLVSTIKRGLRYKTEILNESQSLDQKVYIEGDNNSDDATLLDLLQDEDAVSPENDILAKEQLQMIKTRLFDHLTVMEHHVTEQYLRGYPYKEIAERLEIKAKAVDNAISRVKDKAKNIDISDILKRY